MFSLNIKRINNEYSFTLVRPDTSYISGDRETLKEVFELFEKEEVKWNEKEKSVKVI